MLATALSRLAGVRTGSTDPSSDFWYNPTGYITASGVGITQDSALNIGTAFACIRVLADTVGAMPWQVFREMDDDEKEKAPDHEFYHTIHNRPNTWQTPIDFKSLILVHLQLRGNFYARIDPPGESWPWWQMIPLHPDRVQVEQQSNGKLLYTHTDKLGTRKTYQDDRIFHARMMTNDGVLGMTGATYAREVIGLTSAQLNHAASLFSNGGFFKYYLKTTKKLSEQGIKNFRAGWKNIHGKGGLFEPPILEDDMDLKTLGMSLEDSQWLESRKWNGTEICQFFGVPPHLVFIDSDTKANMEIKGMEFLAIHLNPLLVRIEQALQPHLDDGYFSQFNRDAIVRATLRERYEAHAVALGGRAWKTIDEVRAKEDLPPLGGAAAELPPPPNASLGAKPPSPAKFNQRAEEPPDTEDEQPAGPPPRRAAAAAVDLQPVIADVAERIVTRERKSMENLDAKFSKGATLADKRQYVARWYGQHAEFVARAVGPLVAAYGCDGWQVAMWAESYCAASMNELDGRPVAEVMELWLTTKAAALAADIKERLKCSTL